MTIQGTIQGLHHITLVSANAQRTVDFYVGVLGLRLVKQTVNFDDPGSYHLYFGDETGRPGTAVTFFDWSHAPKGHPAVGGTHHFALQAADYDRLVKWERPLTYPRPRCPVPPPHRHLTALSLHRPP